MYSCFHKTTVFNNDNDDNKKYFLSIKSAY